MKKLLNFLIVPISSVVFTGCEFLGDVIRTGLYSGIFLVVLVIAFIIFITAILSKKK